MIKGRQLLPDEIQDIWTIDRSEVIEAIYTLEDGVLVLKPDYFDVQGWPPGEAEAYTPHMEACYDRGGWFYGLFDGSRLVGLAILDNRFIGKSRDQLQLMFLHVGNGYRSRGWGRRLFELAADEARRRGARRLYISATPSQNTIDFYLNLGCTVTPEPDPDLLALEPDDIHLEYDLPSGVRF